MRAKYVEETIKRWMIFGVHSVSGLVDISDGDSDILTGIKKEEAEKIIEERGKVVNLLIELIGDDYDKFVEIRKKYDGRIK